MDYKFKRCLEEGKLLKIKAEKEIVEKELEGAEFDLKSAQESFKKANHKWATIQAYYSMFHCVKALVLSKGYREKTHYCLLIALKSLYIDTNVLEMRY